MQRKNQRRYNRSERIIDVQCFLQGEISIGLRKIRVKCDRRRDWELVFFKGHYHVANIHFHPDANQYVIETEPDVVLTKETIIKLLRFLHPPVFRETRRWALSQSKKAMRKLKG